MVEDAEEKDNFWGLIGVKYERRGTSSIFELRSGDITYVVYGNYRVHRDEHGSLKSVYFNMEIVTHGGTVKYLIVCNGSDNYKLLVGSDEEDFSSGNGVPEKLSDEELFLVRSMVNEDKGPISRFIMDSLMETEGDSVIRPEQPYELKVRPAIKGVLFSERLKGDKTLDDHYRAILEASLVRRQGSRCDLIITDDYYVTGFNGERALVLFLFVVMKSGRRITEIKNRRAILITTEEIYKAKIGDDGSIIEWKNMAGQDFHLVTEALREVRINGNNGDFLRELKRKHLSSY